MAIDTKHSYTGNASFNKAGDLYIHYHHYCIGLAEKGKAQSDANLASLFSAQKGAAVTASKNYHQTLFLSTLSVKPEQMALLNEVFEGDESQLIKEIDKQTQKILSESMDRESLEKLLEEQKRAAKVAPQLLKNEGKSRLEAFNQILDAIANASKLIDSPYGEELAKALLIVKYKKNVKLTQMGNKLLNAINKFAKDHNIMTFGDQRIKTAISALSTFANTLKTGMTSGGENALTKKSIVKVVDALFNPAFSESVASVMKATLDDGVDIALKGLLTGLNTHKVVLTDENGQILNSLSSLLQKNTKSQGKTDFKFKNVAVHLDYNDYKGSVNMTIGISNKLYRKSKFFNPAKNKEVPNISFKSGSGGTLQEIINSIFPSQETYSRYLAYNAIAHQNDLPASSAALNDLILTRQIVRLFSSRGGKQDFSQYIFFNGVVISMNQILDYIANTSVNRSKSQLTSGSTQAIALTISKRPEIIKATQEKAPAVIRVPKINKIINEATVAAEVHVNKLLAAISKT